jgi:valyl-tRNA synthetase
MLGDTAVAVHPKDTRYSHLIGNKVELPLVNRTIPIIADDYVDPEFGTGCVKITPAHDFNDYELGVRHGLATINIFDKNAHINDSAPGCYVGLDRFDARKRVVEDLDKAGLLEGVDKHTLMVPRGDRSGVIVEPFLTDQWYVRTKPLAKAAIEAVELGNVRFVPENWSKTYFEWMRNIQDWCISRQLWWGHRIPAWYDPDGNVYVARDETEARKKYELSDDLPLHQDEDVLDTWFSSALWPFSTLGWPEDTPEISNFYPTTVLVTGFDIIFFWVARMIMMGIKFMGEVPFREVYIHGLIRDHAGQKMSKTKGNVIDPIDIIDGVKLKTLLAKRTEGLMQQHLTADIERTTRKEFPDGISPFGADALRFTFASLATGGRDINFDFGRVEGYRNFCNKLWNASQYVFSNTSKQELDHLEFTVADRWIRSRFRKTIEKVTTAFHGYRLDLAANALYDFTWHEFCDWYLELTKSSLKRQDIHEAQLNGTRATLTEILGALLRLLHPIMPFITEELWLNLCEHIDKKSDTIMIEAIPNIKDFTSDAEAEEELDWIKEFVSNIRQIRGEMRLNPSQALPVKVSGAQASDHARIEKFKTYLISLAKLESIEFVNNTNAISGAATSLMGKMRLLVPLVGIINPETERNRLKKQRDHAEEDLAKCRKKLKNAQFLKNAPEDVVTKEREKKVKFIQRLEQLNNQLTTLDEII